MERALKPIGKDVDYLARGGMIATVELRFASEVVAWLQAVTPLKTENWSLYLFTWEDVLLG